jgi:hypothetical protein
VTDRWIAFGRALPIALTTGALLLDFGVAPTARATEWPTLDGAYAATSDGQWAKTREVFHDEATTTSTWTITSTCSSHVDCTGTVTSDQGWSADARYSGGLWLVERDLPDWQPCNDGTTASGQQQFTFYRIDATTLVGKDKTMGPSGACGVNAWLTIEMPFKLNKIG